MDDLENKTLEQDATPSNKVDINGVLNSIIQIAEGSRKGIFKISIDHSKIAQALCHIPKIVLKSAIPELERRLDKEVRMNVITTPIGGGLPNIGSSEIATIRTILDAIKERLSSEE